MKAFLRVILFAVCVFGGAAFAAFITVGAWHIQIEPRAFQCWDSVGIFDTYWEGIDEHRGAGDKISPGWTWDEIKIAREIYIGAFFSIWAASALIPFGLILGRPERSNTALQPTPGSAFSSVSRSTLVGPARLSSGR